MRLFSRHGWMGIKNLGRTAARRVSHMNNASRRRKCSEFSRLSFESLEDRRLLAVGNPLVQVETNVGDFVMELLPNEAPLTVQNFLNYVNDGDYINTIFHRSVAGFVIQSGGFTSADEEFTSTAQFSTVPTDPPVVNEFNVSNTLGTVGLARLPGQPNSGTSQWFINLGDNSFLDTQNGGFTVFARVIDMQIPNEIAALSTINAGGGFTDLPLTANNHVVRIESITVDVTAPSFSYVDANNDGVFSLDAGDVRLDAGELDDGRFDTDKAEGGYSTVVQGAGLVIGASSGPIVASKIDFRSDGNLKIDTHLTATKDDVSLKSRGGSVLLDDPTITAPDEIEIEASLDIISTDDVIKATGPRSEVELRAGRDILLFGTSVEAVRDVELRAGESIVVGDSVTPLPGSLTASHPARGEVELRAGLDINVNGAEISAGDEVQLIAGRDIFAVDAIMTALGNSRGEIELKAARDIFASAALLQASDEVELRSTRGSITASSAILEAVGNSKGEVQFIAAGDIVVDGATIRASDEVELKSTRGAISANFATLEALGNSNGEIDLRAAGDITANFALLRANKEVDLRSTGGGISLITSTLSAVGSSKGEIELRAAGDILVSGATALNASDEIELRSTGGSINATGSFFTADEVELRAALDIFFCAANVTASKLKLKFGGILDDAAC